MKRTFNYILLITIFTAGLYGMDKANHEDSSCLNEANSIYVRLLPEFISKGTRDTRNLPQWPTHKNAPPRKCRTIACLASGKYKGKSARIERSCWTEFGIDILSTASFGRFKNPPPYLLKFLCETDPLHTDATQPLYIGKIDDNFTTIIPGSWLSEQDDINLFNFHRYELEILAAHLFGKDAPARLIFKEKIQNAKYRSRGSVFLHAVLLEASKQNDKELLSDKEILHNSVEVLEHNFLKDVKMRDNDLNHKALLEKVKVYLWLISIKEDDKLYTSSLPVDVRTLVFNILLHISDFTK